MKWHLIAASCALSLCSCQTDPQSTTTPAAPSSQGCIQNAEAPTMQQPPADPTEPLPAADMEEEPSTSST